MNSSIPVWVRHAPNRLRYRRIHGIESRLKREPGGRHGRGRRGWGRNRGHSWRCRPRRSWWPKRGQFRSIMSSWIGLYWTIAAVSAVIGSPRWLGRGCLTAADGRQTAVCSAGPIAATDGRRCSATCAAADAATPAATAGRRCAGTAAIAFLVAKFFLTSPFGSPIWKPDLKVSSRDRLSFMSTFLLMLSDRENTKRFYFFLKENSWENIYEVLLKL